MSKANFDDFGNSSIFLCKYCREFYEKYPLDKDGYHSISSNVKVQQIRCAFSNGIFSSDNWNCATVNKLRKIIKREGVFWRNDDIGSIGILSINLDEFCGFLVMLWYKERGQVEQAILLSSERPPALLTLDLALKIIEDYERRHKEFEKAFHSEEVEDK